MEQYLDVLRQCLLFTGLSDQEILLSLDCIGSEVGSFPENSCLLRAGDTTGRIGLLLSGCAMVVQHDLWGNRTIITKLHPGDFFAEPYALLKQEPVRTDVLAEEPCEILNLEGDKLLNMCPTPCGHHSKILQNLVLILSKRTLEYQDKITHMSKRKTRDKLLSYLSEEAMRQGSVCIDIPYDRQQLADYLCVERSAMCVELSRLQQEGILTTQRCHFELNPGRMQGLLW